MTDRYHLCAQHLAGGIATGAASKWLPYVHCMFMNSDMLKCGNNGHCGSRAEFKNALSIVAPMCAELTGMDKRPLQECAEGQLGHELQVASYNRTKATASMSFAPVFVNGRCLQDADHFWRKVPDQLRWGKTVLGAICANSDALPNATCSGLANKSSDRFVI